LIDNLDKLESILKPDLFYNVQILKRKQDGNGKGVILQKITTIDSFKNYYDDYKKIAEVTGGRVYMYPTPVDNKKAMFNLFRRCINVIESEGYEGIKNVYDSVIGSSPSKENKYWIIDIDTKDENIDQLKKIISENTHDKNSISFVLLETPNGYHLLTKPFNLTFFANIYKHDIHKNNPTVLFVP
jgi:hypothetical protein